MTVPRFRTEKRFAAAGQKVAKFAAVLSSREQLEELRAALKDVDMLDLDLRVGTLEDVQPTLINGHAPDVLLVDFGANQEGTLSVLARMLRERPAEFPVLATGEDASVDMIRRLMRLGIADFVPRPFNRADILAGLNAALSKRPLRYETRGKRGKVLTFTRSCGGNGATLLAIQTAAELNSRSKGARPSVCVIDFDLQFGNVATSLDLRPSVGLLQILETPSRLDEDFLASVTMHHASGLDIIAAPGRIVPTDALTIETATQIVALATQAYDYVVIDLPRSWTNWALGLLKASDVVVLITEITVAAMQRSLQLFELMVQQELQGVPVQIVMNRFASGWTGRTGKVHQAEMILGRKIDFLVRSDPKTATDARDGGVLLQEVSRRSKIERDIRRFVDRVIADFSRQESEIETTVRRDQHLKVEGGYVLQTV